jgi:ABC-2 type transport system ATP-binding protein
MNTIELRALTRRYGTRRGVENLNLAIPEGSLFGFLGPNGAGKTTAIRVLLGLLRPTAGAASVFGLDCWRGSARIKADVGYIPGDLRLYPWMTGHSALATFGRVRKRDLFRRGRELAERFGLDLSVRVRTMSKGMRQKLGLILAMAHAPRLLILDEPTSGLDPLMQDQLREQLKSLAAAGHTVFFSSHTLGEVEALCDRVAIVKDGSIVADQTLEQLRSHAGHDVAIRWRPGSPVPPPPPFLQLAASNDHEWSGSLVGPVSQLTDWLAGKPIADLTIRPPDLESLFRRFYEPGGPR